MRGEGTTPRAGRKVIEGKKRRDMGKRTQNILRKYGAR